MSTRVALVRHGATTLSAEDRFAGATDVELSDAGRAQAQALAERLAGEPITAVYASPLRRTLETAAILASPHGLEPLPRPGLREIDHGHWETLTRADVEARFSEEYAAWEGDPFVFAPSGGESGATVMARALPVLREIVLSHAGEYVLVVSHKATIRLALCALLGIDARGYRDRLDQAPACLNLLEFKDAGRARLMLYNDVSHYAEAPRRPAGQLSKWWA
jgi:broad specificity phosphatase PhoE